MIEFKKHTLDNGLKIITHVDTSTSMVAVNTLYDVGSRNEDPERTGFAHLFEHLMFGGSKNIPNFDGPLQQVGGENNAFTTDDYTNYYITLPVNNIDTAFWLESDRMLELDFSEKSLNVQKSVVIEEFKQRYLNQPYGDIKLLLRPLVYKKHPYQWPTIGKNIQHIEKATLTDVKDFFYQYYAPDNAILSIAGNFQPQKILDKINNWYGKIPQRDIVKNKLPVEPTQVEKRTLHVERDVPYDMIIKCFHTGSRYADDFYTMDLISDIFSQGKSSRFYKTLVKDKKLFSYADCYISGSLDPGLIYFVGNLLPGTSFVDAEKAIDEEINKLKAQAINERELQKIKNKVAFNLEYSNIGVLNKAMNLAYFEMLGNANLLNEETKKYEAVTIDDILKISNKYLVESNSSVIYYKGSQFMK